MYFPVQIKHSLFVYIIVIFLSFVNFNQVTRVFGGLSIILTKLIFDSLQSFHRYYSATSDVLMSVKKVEDSLKRLKKNRGTDKNAGNQGMTDDDKIRQQFIVDIESFGAQVIRNDM